MLWRIAFTLMMASALACAQEEGGGGGIGSSRMDRGGGRGGEGGGGGGGMRAPRQTPFDVFADKLKLNKDQKTEARSILADASKEVTGTLQQLQQARHDLAGVYINGADDHADQILKQFVPLTAQLAGIETNAFARICKLLKPNQRKNAPQAFELLAEMFDRAGGNSRGGNRGEREERGER
jgi:hypothetical protein